MKIIETITERYKVLDVREIMKPSWHIYILILEDQFGKRRRIWFEDEECSKSSEHSVVIPGDNITLTTEKIKRSVMYCVTIL